MLIILWYNNFYPRSPRGERRNREQQPRGIPWISIHAPLAGSDNMLVNIYAIKDISIHAPLAGSDAHTYCGTSSIF